MTKPVLGVATYTAVQGPKLVTLTARGVNSTPNWRNWLERLPADTAPPQFRFLWQPPPGQVIQVPKAFRVTTTFPAIHPVHFVPVRDAKGPHKVKVTQQPPAKARKAPKARKTSNPRKVSKTAARRSRPA